MTKESKRRKRKGSKGRKGKGHIIIYTCARERRKGRLKDAPHAGGRGGNTKRRRGSDTETIRGKAREKRGRCGGKKDTTQHAPILFYKKRRKEDRLTTETDSLLERKGISRRLKRFHSGTETVSVAD
ncbi:hypothetical protein C3V43_00025 [Bacteroides heparinolyticus]|nr:hypothetical protein C3V43_00025 [Bacteroides heparinolyticus]